MQYIAEEQHKVREKQDENLELRQLKENLIDQLRVKRAKDLSQEIDVDECLRG